MDLPGENPLIRKCLRVSRTTRFSAPPFAFLGLALWSPIEQVLRNATKLALDRQAKQFECRQPSSPGCWSRGKRNQRMPVIGEHVCVFRRLLLGPHECVATSRSNTVCR